MNMAAAIGDAVANALSNGAGGGAVVIREPELTVQSMAEALKSLLEDPERLARMSAAADRPLNWNVLTVDSRVPERIGRQLGAADRAAELGGRVVALKDLLASLPNIPTVAEGLPGFQFGAWVGVVARAKTASEILTRLSATLASAIWLDKRDCWEIAIEGAQLLTARCLVDAGRQRADAAGGGHARGDGAQDGALHRPHGGMHLGAVARG